MHFQQQFPKWDSTVLRVSGLIGRHPDLLGRLAGYLLGLAFAVGLGASVMGAKIREIDDGHARIVGLVKAIQRDAGSLLKELNASHRPGCDAVNLTALRALLVGRPHVHVVGMLDPQGRLFCTTSLGQLATPVSMGSNAVDGALGRYIFDSPLAPFNGKPLSRQTVNILERGRFQAVVDDSATSAAFQHYSDAVWAGGGAQRKLLYRRPGIATGTPAGHTAHLTLDWKQLDVLVSSETGGATPLVIQTALRTNKLGTDPLALLAGILAASALLGFFAGQTLSARFHHLRSMDFRIRSLCNEANIVCHFQPIVHLASGRVIGCEALGRLRDGDQLLYPDQFIPALNHCGLTWRFDAAVSRCALLSLGGALPPQADFRVALNFFSQSLHRDTLHGHLQAVLQGAGRSDLQIELEVTEYAFSPAIVPELKRLKDDGYAISIDDFGTGYSNLRLVNQVVPDYLKIDRSFVFEMEDLTLRSSLIPEIVAIADAVGSKVIAEGIENAAQAEKLKALGIEYGQGYYYARPLPLDAFLRLLAQPSA